MAFDVKFLNKIRSYEYAILKELLPPGCRVLEIGAGTGEQSKRLHEDGFQVVAIDVACSNYSSERVFDVIDYDGKILPFENGSFDVVFSSNVLEHIKDVSAMNLEIARVLKSSGFVVHILPTPAWRIWTLISGYIIGVIGLFDIVKSILKSIAAKDKINWKAVISTWRFLLKDYFMPARHGERGSAWSEIYYFSTCYWKSVFKSHYAIKSCTPSRLFYTGNMLFGNDIKLSKRAGISRLLGSACNVFVLYPA